MLRILSLLVRKYMFTYSQYKLFFSLFLIYNPILIWYTIIFFSIDFIFKVIPPSESLIKSFKKQINYLLTLTVIVHMLQIQRDRGKWQENALWKPFIHKHYKYYIILSISLLSNYLHVTFGKYDRNNHYSGYRLQYQRFI